VNGIDGVFPDFIEPGEVHAEAVLNYSLLSGNTCFER
jgi:hypothetical protein